MSRVYKALPPVRLAVISLFLYQSFCIRPSDYFWAEHPTQRKELHYLRGTVYMRSCFIPPGPSTMGRRIRRPCVLWMEDAVDVYTDGSWKQVGTLRNWLHRHTGTEAGSSIVKRTLSGEYEAIRLEYGDYVPPDAYTAELLALSHAGLYLWECNYSLRLSKCDCDGRKSAVIHLKINTYLSSVHVSGRPR